MKLRRGAAVLAVLPAWAASFSGQSALEFAKKATAFGPRPPGSEANRRLAAFIAAQARASGAQVIEDAFVAKTPKGDIAMKNIIAKFPGKSGKPIAITGILIQNYSRAANSSAQTTGD